MAKPLRHPEIVGKRPRFRLLQFVFTELRTWVRYLPSLTFTKRRISRLARRRGIKPKWVRHIGALSVDPKHLAIWIATDKDWERDQLRDDPTFAPECRAALLKSGYPEHAIPFAGIAIQSQQSVDRNSSGRWHCAMK